MRVRGVSYQLGSAVAVIAVLALTTEASAQQSNYPTPPWANRNPGASSGGTKAQPAPGGTLPGAKGARPGSTTGNRGTVSGAATTMPGDPSSGGGVGGGFGSSGQLTPEQNLIVLLNTLVIVEELLQVIQPTSELEILFVFLMVYFEQYQAAVDALLGGGDGNGGTPIPIEGGGIGGPPATTPTATVAGPGAPRFNGGGFTPPRSGGVPRNNSGNRGGP